MTYRQYYIKLIKDLSKLETFNEEQYQTLKGHKDYLDKGGRETYQSTQDDMTSLMKKCERVSELIATKLVNSTDPIDPEVLGFLPTDIRE